MMTQMLIAADLDLSAGLCYASLSKDQAGKDSATRP
jgi:hypothetical protein